MPHDQKRPKHLKTPMTLRDPILTTYSHLTMDAIGPFTRAQDKSRYIHVVVDHATRHVTAWASEENTSASVAMEFFNRVICIHGTPSVLNTDNASVYKSKLFEDFCSKFGITHVTGSSFWSRSQGLVERYNQAIESSLRAFVSKAQKHWATFLQAVVFSLNNTICSILGYAPNLLVFGKQTHLPTEAALSLVKSEGFKNTKNLAVHLLTQREKIQLKAAENMRQAHRKMKARHDADAVDSGYTLGQLVYLHIPTLLRKGTSKKLQPTYSGPYIIIRKTSPVTVVLRRLQDGHVFKKSIHVSRLRRPLSRTSSRAILSRLEMGPTTGLFNPDQMNLETETESITHQVAKRGRPRKNKPESQSPKVKRLCKKPRIAKPRSPT